MLFHASIKHRNSCCRQKLLLSRLFARLRTKWTYLPFQIQQTAMCVFVWKSQYITMFVFMHKIKFDSLSKIIENTKMSISWQYDIYVWISSQSNSQSTNTGIMITEYLLLSYSEVIVSSFQWDSVNILTG